jgi:hypothetical protein
MAINPVRGLKLHSFFFQLFNQLCGDKQPDAIYVDGLATASRREETLVERGSAKELIDAVAAVFVSARRASHVEESVSVSACFTAPVERPAVSTIALGLRRGFGVAVDVVEETGPIWVLQGVLHVQSLKLFNELVI